MTFFSKWVTRLINKRKFLQNYPENHNVFHQFLLFHTWIQVKQCFSWKTTSISARSSRRILTCLHFFNGPCDITLQKIIWSRILIVFIFRSWRRIAHIAFIDEQLLIFANFSYSTLLKKHLTASIQQSGKECWVRVASSTWSVLWLWNINKETQVQKTTWKIVNTIIEQKRPWCPDDTKPQLETSVAMFLSRWKLAHELCSTSNKIGILQ